MPYAPSETWDLDAILPGGPAGDAFREAADALQRDLDALVARADALPAHPDPAAFAQLLLDFEELSGRLEQVGTFAGCHAAADATGKAAIRAESRVTELGNRYSRALVVPNARIAFGDAADFDALLARPEIDHMRGMLLEKRRLARFRLPEAEEALATELARDGLLAWGELYDVESGALKIPFDRGHGEELLSPGQLAPLVSHDDKATRDRAHAAYVAGWRTLADRCAKALTHITGTRMVLNERRKLDELEEPLAGAKIERRTLDAMMEAARRAQPLLHRYLALKAKAMGQPKLTWADTVAGLGNSTGKVPYGEAQSFIVAQFGEFSPRFADFARRALAGRWVEVEDRAGKRGGGFCADVPLSKESRIFMTWGGNARSVSTLAHELGHAFHNEVLHAVPLSQRRVPMTLAETASTFAEALVREASLARTTDADERLRLLDGSMGDALAFLANVPARFELERAFYRLRAAGPLEAEALEQETVAIFSRWYGPAVEAVDPMFWASKLHFYIAGLSFYNFPYTFGYLFANLVYETFRPQGAAGLAGYERLLRRTGDEWAEPIARDELGVDLGEPDTWMRAIRPVERDFAALQTMIEGS
ncbi:MAG: M3 family metallopeptidase [Myxococcota bacterium]